MKITTLELHNINIFILALKKVNNFKHMILLCTLKDDSLILQYEIFFPHNVSMSWYFTRNSDHDSALYE